MAAGDELLFWWARLLFEEFLSVSTRRYGPPETSTASSHLPDPLRAAA
jgi:hypothetical protein